MREVLHTPPTAFMLLAVCLVGASMIFVYAVRRAMEGHRILELAHSESAEGQP